MTEHRRNIMVTDCLEANAFYNSRDPFHLPERKAVYGVIAEAYLMRSESLTNYNTER